MHLFELIGSPSETYSSQLTERLSLSFKPLFKAKKQWRALHWNPQDLNTQNLVQPTALQLMSAAGSELMPTAISLYKPLNMDFRTQMQTVSLEPSMHSTSMHRSVCTWKPLQSHWQVKTELENNIQKCTMITEVPKPAKFFNCGIPEPIPTYTLPQSFKTATLGFYSSFTQTLYAPIHILKLITQNPLV